ncbi:DoxX family protein [Wenjunlia vitaminophila]|uniref:DoxX family protein n=1 Tax=Wenjunlia vitaminophila TaxID=76728 RepID=UPI00038259D5|nr:DoxX family protein [Wenjunlia vitaminophila]
MIRAVRVPSDPAQIYVSQASFRVRFAQLPAAASSFVPAPLRPRLVPHGRGARPIQVRPRLPRERRGAGALGGAPSAADPRADGPRPEPPTGEAPLGPPALGVHPGGAFPTELARGARVLRAGRAATGPAPAAGQRPRVPGARQAAISGTPAGGSATGGPPGYGPAPGSDLETTQPLAPVLQDDTRPLPRVQEFAEPPVATVFGRFGDHDEDGVHDEDGGPWAARPGSGAPGGHPAPQARRNPGVVLLPLRVFLGGISVYAGMGKLCDPVYFDGGERGSMVAWLSSLHPWTAVEPLRHFALSHPVGAGLTVAFLQIVVGVLSVLGLWQRAAAGAGMLLSAALLLTVSWRTVPVYEAPDVVYLAAWSPLLIAGAPYGSLDARLAERGRRRFGHRAPPGERRRWVLRRGAVVVTVVSGLCLLTGSLFGAAVRSGGAHTDPVAPTAPPTNNLPGSPLPTRSSGEPDGGVRSPLPPRSAPSGPSAGPTPAVPPLPGTGTSTGAGDAPAVGGTVTPTQGTDPWATQVPEPVAPGRTLTPSAPSAGPDLGGGGTAVDGGRGSGGALGGILGRGLLGMEAGAAQGDAEA